MYDADFKQPVGVVHVVAHVDDGFDYGNAEYTVYRSGRAVKRAKGLKPMVKALVDAGLVFSEIEYAVEVMAANKHDTIEFGVYGGFLFSKDSLDSSGGAQ